MIYKNKQINIKLSKEELSEIKHKSKLLKFATVSEYVRFVILNASVEVKAK